MSGVYYIIAVMENKILILLMSCNQPLYEEEERACRETFLRDAEGAGVPYWFYRGGAESPLTDPVTRVMTLPSGDGLGSTSRKTVMALAAALQDDSWDYLVKTNVSTWLDVPKLLSAVSRWEGRDDPRVYGSRFLANAASKDVPFPRGNLTILSRSLAEAVVRVAPGLLKSGSMPRTDDTLLCLCLLYHIQREMGLRYTDSLMEVPSVTAWSDKAYESPEWTDALSVRCKDEESPEETPGNMRRAHAWKREPPEREWRRPMGPVETALGLMPYGRYDRIMAEARKRKGGEKTPPADPSPDSNPPPTP